VAVLGQISPELMKAMSQHAAFAQGRGGRRLIVQNADLTGLNARGLNLHRAVVLGSRFNKVSLEAADFSEADLTGSVFYFSRLTGCDFSRAQLRGVRFHDSDMSGARITGADMQTAPPAFQYRNDGTMQEVQSRTTEISSCNLEGADLEGASLAGITLKAVNLRGANLRGANLAGTQLTSVVLDGARLEGARFDGAVLQDVVLGSNAEAAALGAAQAVNSLRLDDGGQALAMLKGHKEWVAALGRTGQRADFAGRVLRDIDLSGLDLSAVSFARAELLGLRFDAAVLASCDFTGATLRYCTFAEADLRAAIFAKAVVSHCRMSGATLKPLKLRDSGREVPVRFEGARFDWVDFTGAKLDREALRNALATNCRF
jgi:uncharacterized protein YjbI with pentapeptide repeats